MLFKKSNLKGLFDLRPFANKYFSTIDGKPCNSCGGKNFIMRFMCGSCHILQDPTTNIEKLNYFQVLNTPLSFHIDKKKLEREFKNLQMFFHPDKINSSHSESQPFADAYSSTLNEAYTTLKDDFSRAKYLLELKGYKLEEGNRLDDIEFMEEVLEKRSQIEESTNYEEIKTLKGENDKILHSYIQEIANNIDKEEYSEALKLIEKSQYFHRIDEAINHWEEKHKIH